MNTHRLRAPNVSESRNPGIQEGVSRAYPASAIADNPSPAPGVPPAFSLHEKWQSKTRHSVLPHMTGVRPRRVHSEDEMWRSAVEKAITGTIWRDAEKGGGGGGGGSMHLRTRSKSEPTGKFTPLLRLLFVRPSGWASRLATTSRGVAEKRKKKFDPYRSVFSLVNRSLPRAFVACWRDPEIPRNTFYGAKWSDVP